MKTYHIPADTNVIRYTTRGIREHALTRFPVTYTDMEMVAQSMNQDGKPMVYRFRIPVAQYSWLWIEVDAHLVIVSTMPFTTTYHIPAKTVGTRQRRHGDNTWQSFITSRAVTYGDGDVHLNSDDLIFWIPDFEYWMVRFKRKDVEII